MTFWFHKLKNGKISNNDQIMNAMTIFTIAGAMYLKKQNIKWWKYFMVVSILLCITLASIPQKKEIKEREYEYLDDIKIPKFII